MQLIQLKRPFVHSWPPTADVRYDELNPIELYDYGLTTAARGVYVNEDQVAVVANSKEEALNVTKKFLADTGYLKDTYGDKEPVWRREKNPEINEVAHALETKSWDLAD